MSDQNDPKILVKKSDGTFVHMPLSELQKISETKKAEVAPTKSEAPKEPEKLPVKILEAKPTKNPPPAVKSVNVIPKEVSPPANLPIETETPKKKIEVVEPVKVVKPEIKAAAAVAIKSAPLAPRAIPPTPPKELEKVMEKVDSSSLLEEKLPASKATAPFASESREKQVDEVMNKLTFKAPVGNNTRLRTIIQLFLKDVRSEEQTKDVLVRREIEGGVGLSIGQAEEVITKSKEKMNRSSTAPVVSVNPAGLKMDQKTNERLEKELPGKRPAAPFPMVVNSTKEAYVHKPVRPMTAPIVAPISAPVKEKEKPIVKPEIKFNLDLVAPADFKLTDRGRTTMHDVANVPLELGPVDEIRYFSLVDFRRLSSDPAEAANRLKQKILNLKDESIVLFFEAMEAWRTSPLYLDYLGLVGEALAKRMEISKIASDKRRVQLPEVVALVQMEKELA